MSGKTIFSLGSSQPSTLKSSNACFKGPKDVSKNIAFSSELRVIHGKEMKIGVSALYQAQHLVSGPLYR